MPAGRPTAYRAEFCDKVQDLGEQGYSYVQIAHALGVVRDTLNDWCKTHPEFSVAITRAREASQAFWELQGMRGTLGEIPGFNASSWSRSMAARFPKDWTERKQTQIDAVMQVEQKRTIDPALLSMEQRELLRDMLTKMLPAPVEEGEYREVDE